MQFREKTPRTITAAQALINGAGEEQATSSHASRIWQAHSCHEPPDTPRMSIGPPSAQTFNSPRIVAMR